MVIVANNLSIFDRNKNNFSGHIRFYYKGRGTKNGGLSVSWKSHQFHGVNLGERSARPVLCVVGSALSLVPCNVNAFSDVIDFLLRSCGLYRLLRQEAFMSLGNATA